MTEAEQFMLAAFYLVHVLLLLVVWRRRWMPAPVSSPEAPWSSIDKLTHIIAGLGMMVFAQSFFGLPAFVGWSACLTVMIVFELLRLHPYRPSTELRSCHFSWRNVLMFCCGTLCGFLYYWLLFFFSRS